MPLVFVHGVNVRKDAEYKASEKVRNELFCRSSLVSVLPDPDPSKVLNPYWGGDAATFYWNHACLPLEENEQFGIGPGAHEEIVAEMAPDAANESGERVLLELARLDLRRAIDCLWATAAFTPPDAGQDVAAPLAVIGRKAAAYAQAHPLPEWVTDQKLNNDDQFVDQLLGTVRVWSEAGAGKATAVGTESFGLSDAWNHLKLAATRLAAAAANHARAAADRLKRVAGQVGEAGADLGSRLAGRLFNPFVRAARPWAHHRVSLFLGDVFIYLSQRGAPRAEGKIVQIVADALQEGAEAVQRSGGRDKLIVVAHSMGGNIAYDILTYFRPHIYCDLLLTVGSQVGLFEELKLFGSSIRGFPRIPGSPAKHELVPLPSNIGTWLNVFDPSDVLGYSTARIFQGSKDFAFLTDTLVTSAHSMYFYRPNFHQRLNVRLREVLG
jgi:hypothetical protein